MLELPIYLLLALLISLLLRHASFNSSFSPLLWLWLLGSFGKCCYESMKLIGAPELHAFRVWSHQPRVAGTVALRNTSVHQRWQAISSRQETLEIRWWHLSPCGLRSWQHHGQPSSHRTTDSLASRWRELRPAWRPVYCIYLCRREHEPCLHWDSESATAPRHSAWRICFDRFIVS